MISGDFLLLADMNLSVGKWRNSGCLAINV